MSDYSCKIHGYFSSTVIKGDVPCPWCERDTLTAEGARKDAVIEAARKAHDALHNRSDDILNNEYWLLRNALHDLDSASGNQECNHKDKGYYVKNDVKHCVECLQPIEIFAGTKEALEKLSISSQKS